MSMRVRSSEATDDQLGLGSLQEVKYKNTKFNPNKRADMSVTVPPPARLQYTSCEHVYYITTETRRVPNQKLIQIIEAHMLKFDHYPTPYRLYCD